MDYFTPLDNLLKNSARHPNKTFLYQPINREWHEFTWADVEHQARCIAAGLKLQGFERGSRIGILSKNCAQWIIVDLAIMMANMISVPIYSTASRETIKHIIKHADLKAIFIGKLDDTTEAEVAIGDIILSIALPYPTVQTKVQFVDWLSSNKPLEAIHQPDINDIATISYTSGSTGLPKGVVLTHKNLASVAQNLVSKFNVTDSFRALSYLPLAHIVERSNEYVCLFSGSKAYFVESLDTFIDDLQYAQPTGFISVPRLWTIFQGNVLKKLPQKKLSLLLKFPFIRHLATKKIHAALGLSQAEWFVSGTAPISTSLLNWYMTIGMPICEGWGMTETSGAACLNFPCSKQNLGTIGKPLPCVEMKLSAQGEVLIRGDSVFSEYYLDPQATADSFVDGWFHTGDCAEVNVDGEYIIVGRIKDKFKTSKGKYVAPVPIESLLCTNPDIEQVCVMGSGMKQPIALVILASTSRKDIEMVERLKKTLTLVNEKLESHQKLDHLIICNEVWSVENNILTPSMKIKRNVIEHKYKDLLNMELTELVIFEEDVI